MNNGPAQTSKETATVRAGVLYAFACLEVVGHQLPQPLQAAIAGVAYAFVAFCVLWRPRTGLAYLVAFTLLSIAGWSNVGVESEMPANFWGLRFAGFSFNIMFSAAIALLCFGMRPKRRLASLGPVGLYLALFVVYSLVLGAISVVRGINYFDNFARDALSYVPFFIWAYFVGLIRAADALAVCKHGLSAAVASMTLAYLIGARFDYGSGNEFVLMSSLGFLAIFAVPFCRAYYRRGQFLALLAAMALLIGSGSVFIGGKMIVIGLIAGFWLLYRWHRNLFLWVLLTVMMIPWVSPTAQFFIERMDERSVTRYKLVQVASVFEVGSVHSLAALPTSMGNLVAEGVTTARYLADNPAYLLAGKGFGGGVEDVFGYLSPGARPGYGYAEQDAVRNDFVRLHLPVFEVVLKAGLGGLIFYAFVLISCLRTRYTFSFITAILMFTIFYISKEMLLLTVLLVRLAMIERHTYAAATIVNHDLPAKAAANVIPVPS